MFSPRFKSVAAMAGWDEEALMLATFIVEDTPDRNAKNKKRSDLIVISPRSSSRRKRRARRRSPASMSIAVLNLDDEDSTTNTIDKGNEKKEECTKIESPQKVKIDQEKVEKGNAASASSSSVTLPCVDRLREELSCAICLEICYEPSTTPCGHSFCKKCLKNAADKCGKRCPKCRQLISNGRSCTINTVLWNTIQLLFPVEVEARKATESQNSREIERQSPEVTNPLVTNLRTTRRLRPVGTRREDNTLSRREDVSINRGRQVASQDEDAALALRLQREDNHRLSRRADVSRSRGRGVATQDEDAALALRLQRDEFMTMYRGGSSLARDNLRAMAQRAINLRVRNRAV